MKFNVTHDDEYKIIETMHQLDSEFDEPETVGEITRVRITGDWKHSHARADYLMEKLGYNCLLEEIYGDDSDWYTANHYYAKKLSKRKKVNIESFEKKLEEQFNETVKAIKEGKFRLIEVEN